MDKPALFFQGRPPVKPERAGPRPDFAFPKTARPPIDWARWRDIPLAILAWTAVVLVGLWLLSHAVQSLLVLALAALLAYALEPLARWVGRFMPRPLAVSVVTLVVLGSIAYLLYLIFTTAFHQLLSLTQSASTAQLVGLERVLQNLGIPQQQSQSFGDQIIAELQQVENGIVPFVFSALSGVINILMVIVLTVYFMLGGMDIVHWLRTRLPANQQRRMNFLLETLERVVGGYVRGQFILSLLVGIAVGVGMAMLHVHYAVLLGVAAFALEFVPYLGTLTSGVICVVVALTQSWVLAILVLAYFVGVHILEGYVVGPRIVGRAVGLHPAVSLFALILGAEVFGVWGALFAAPAAGLIASLLRALWLDWRATHPDQFPKEVALEDDVPPATAS